MQNNYDHFTIQTINQDKFHINKYILKMANKVRDINMKNHTYYFSNDIINIENFDPNNTILEL